MPTVEELLESADVQSYVQQREYPLTVGDTLFPSTKIDDFEIEYILGANEAPVSASVHAEDTESQVATREGFETVKQGLASIKRKIMMNERLIKQLSRARQDAEVQQVIDRIYNDVDNMVNAVRTRVEAMRFEAVSSGQLSINENGFKTTVDYRVPEGHKTALSGTDLWTDFNANPLEDIESWVNQVIESTGTTPTRMLTSNKVFNTLKRHGTISKAINGDNGRLVTNAELNTFLQEQGLPAIATDDRRYRVQVNDGSYETRRFFPEEKIVLLPSEALGQTVYGLTAEEVELQNITSSQFQNFGNIIAQIYSTPDPVARWTKAVATALPSFPTANQVFIASVVGSGSNGQVGNGGEA